MLNISQPYPHARTIICLTYQIFPPVCFVKRIQGSEESSFILVKNVFNVQSVHNLEFRFQDLFLISLSMHFTWYICYNKTFNESRNASTVVGSWNSRGKDLENCTVDLPVFSTDWFQVFLYSVKHFSVTKNRGRGILRGGKITVLSPNFRGESLIHNSCTAFNTCCLSWKLYCSHCAEGDLGASDRFVFITRKE